MENGGMEAMVHELMHWNPKNVGLTWHDLRRPPVTDSLREQAGMGLSGPAEELVSMIEAEEISGRTKGGVDFHYPLKDDEKTLVARNHLVAALTGKTGYGNLSHEMKEAIATFLGDDADQGESKSKITYFGPVDPSDGKREEFETEKRERHVIVPPLNNLKDILKRYGRGC